MAVNVTDTAQQQNVVKALLLALSDLDSQVVDTCRFILSVLSSDMGRSYVSDTDMTAFDDSHGNYRENEYDLPSSIQYLSSLPKLERTWTSMIGLIMVGCTNLTNATISVWKIRLGRIEKTGERTWQSAVPALRAIYLITGEGKGDEILTTMFRKLDVLDDLLDMKSLQEAGIVQRGSPSKSIRFSDELQDTMTAISKWEKSPGVLYSPPPTEEYIKKAKAQIREQRKALQAIDVQPREVGGGSPANAAVAYEKSGGKWDSSITAFICIAIALAFIPGALAWSHSPHMPGTKDDADFYFLIQTSLMQILGLLTLVLPVLAKFQHPQQAWYWMWAFVGVSSVFSVVAVVLYLYLPTEWAQTVSFLGSVAQAFAILQTMFLINKPSNTVAKN